MAKESEIHDPIISTEYGPMHLSAINGILNHVISELMNLYREAFDQKKIIIKYYKMPAFRDPSGRLYTVVTILFYKKMPSGIITDNLIRSQSISLVRGNIPNRKENVEFAVLKCFKSIYGGNFTWYRIKHRISCGVIITIVLLIYIYIILNFMHDCVGYQP
jgi:hypothetical protein